MSCHSSSWKLCYQHELVQYRGIKTLKHPMFRSIVSNTVKMLLLLYLKVLAWGIFFPVYQKNAEYFGLPLYCLGHIYLHYSFHKHLLMLLLLFFYTCLFLNYAYKVVGFVFMSTTHYRRSEEQLFGINTDSWMSFTYCRCCSLDFDITLLSNVFC